MYKQFSKKHQSWFLPEIYLEKKENTEKQEGLIFLGRAQELSVAIFLLTLLRSTACGKMEGSQWIFMF